MHTWQKNLATLIVLAAGFMVIPACLALPGPSVSLALIPSTPYDNQMTGSAGYSSLEPVNLNITLRNNGPGPVTILGVPPRMGVNHIEGRDIRTWQRNTSVLVLREGETVTTFLSWDQRDDKGVPVPPGVYTVGAYYLYRGGDSPEAQDLSGAEPLTGTARILIAPPGGILMRNISLHISRQDNGVNATLVSLESGSGKGIASFDVEIPEKVRDITPRPEGVVPCDVSAYPAAEYRIGQGPFQKFLDMDFVCASTPRQIHRTHLYFEPLPADAKMMDIHVTKFGNHHGSWDYPVDLTANSSVTPGPRSIDTGTTGNQSQDSVIIREIPKSLPTQKSASMPGLIPVISTGLGAWVIRKRWQKK